MAHALRNELVCHWPAPLAWVHYHPLQPHPLNHSLHPCHAQVRPPQCRWGALPSEWAVFVDETVGCEWGRAQLQVEGARALQGQCPGL